jgi:MoxR-like ATPase
MSDLPQPAAETSPLADIRAVQSGLSAVRDEIARHVFGQKMVVSSLLVTLLCGGHALLQGVPGLAKTTLVEAVSKAFGMNANRVQCTPDLMPADILGSEVLEEHSGQRSFRLIQGPVFCQLLMADEINRASPKTQSALLQAMQEHRVTLAGTTYPLPAPFHVLATQNPLEQEGTYPLPEAQLDRFFMQILVDYPDAATEREILLRTTGTVQKPPRQVADAALLLKGQEIIRRMPVGEQVMNLVIDLVRATRPEQTTIDRVRRSLVWGASPRAGQALMLGMRAQALMDGRFAPSADDLAALAAPVLRHRLGLGFEARAAGVRIDDLIAEVVAAVRAQHAL